MAGLWLGGGSANSGGVDDNPGPRILDTRQHFRHLELRKIGTPHEKDQLLDAQIFLLRCVTRNNASGDHRRHDASSSRRLSLHEIICGFRPRSRRDTQCMERYQR
jgi:hypothetical protein